MERAEREGRVGNIKSDQQRIFLCSLKPRAALDGRRRRKRKRRRAAQRWKEREKGRWKGAEKTVTQKVSQQCVSSPSGKV